MHLAVVRGLFVSFLSICLGFILWLLLVCGSGLQIPRDQIDFVKLVKLHVFLQGKKSGSLLLKVAL